MLIGVPVISTRNGGAEDTINESNGILVNTYDYLGFAEKALAIINGNLTIDPDVMRYDVIAQSGRAAFWKNILAFLQ